MGYGLPDTENFAAPQPQTPDPVANMFGGGGMFDEPAPPQHTEITAKIGQPSSQNPNPSSAFAMSNFGTIPKSFDDWIADPQNVQKIPTRPIVPGQTGKSFAGMALATALDSIGSALSGNKPTVGANWNSQVQAGREYDRQAPAMQQQANEAGYYGKYLPGQNLTSEINQRNMVNPFYQKGMDLRNELTQMWQSGQVSPENYDKAVALKLQGNPYARLITPDVLNQIKQLPTTPPKFTVGPNGIEPIIYRGQNYGVKPAQGEPTEITQARQMALDAQNQNQTTELNKKAAEFPPVVTAKLGPAPISDPVALAAYGEKAQKIITEMATDPKLAAALARPVVVLDPNHPGNATYMSGGEAIKSGASAGDKVNSSDVLKQQAIFKDINRVTDNVSNSVKAMDQGEGQRALVSQALADPHNTTADNFVRSEFAKNMTPQSRDYVANVLSLREQVQGMSKLMGANGTSDSRIKAIYDTLPGAEPDSDMARRKIDLAKKMLSNLGESVPQVPSLQTGATGGASHIVYSNGKRIGTATPEQQKKGEYTPD